MKQFSVSFFTLQLLLSAFWQTIIMYHPNTANHTFYIQHSKQSQYYV